MNKWREDTEKRLQRAMRRGWSYPDIADHAGVTLSWLQKFGRGEPDNPGLETVYQLNQALKTLGHRP